MDNIQKFPAGNSFVTLGAGEMIQGATGADLVLGLIEMKVVFCHINPLSVSGT